jgi:hypothetical protein
MMLRAVNFALVLMTGLICLGVYRVAEEARIAAVELRETKTAIVQENRSITVLGAEWARLTQPSRIQVLAERYLGLTDRPTARFTSVTDLPPKFLPRPEDAIRNANAVISQSAPHPGAPPLPPQNVVHVQLSSRAGT